MIDDCLSALRFYPDWLVTDKMIRKLHEDFFANDDIHFNLDNVDFYKNNPKTIVHIRLLVWRNKFEERKAFKKDISKELMSVAWRSTRLWGWCMLEDEKRE